LAVAECATPTLNVEHSIAAGVEKRLRDPGCISSCGHVEMNGHGLMQAIARVNRVFRDKPGGLVVDYLGLAEQLQRAVST
jgi:hypothetical protein